MVTGLDDSDFITDFITGEKLLLDEHEPVRQQIERLLIESKGYDKQDIAVNTWLDLEIDGRRESFRLDLIAHVDGKPAALIKTNRGSIVSRERETLAAARLAGAHQIPLSVVTNGETAEVFDTATGKMIAEGLEAIPSKTEAAEKLQNNPPAPLPDKKRAGEQRILMAFLSWKCKKD